MNYPVKNSSNSALLGLPIDATLSEFQAAFDANDGLGGGVGFERKSAAIVTALISLAMRERNLSRADAVAYCHERYPILREAMPTDKAALANSAKALVALANELFTTGAYENFESAYAAAKDRNPALTQKMIAASGKAKEFTPSATRNLHALANEKFAKGGFATYGEAVEHTKLMQD